MQSSKALRVFAAVSLGLHVIAGAGVGVATRARPEPKPAPVATSTGLTGESFEVAEDDEPEQSPTAAPDPTSPAPDPAPRTKPKPRARTVQHAGAAGSGTVAAVATERTMYGAVGERGVFDLASAFTLQFPQASSPDPVWATVPLGDAGTVEVTLTIDERGALTDATLGAGGSPALRAAVTRTVKLIRGRTFVARGARTTLRVSAKVSPDTVHDGVHGDVFAIGQAWHEPEGTAFFALAIGRRIDVTIRSR